MPAGRMGLSNAYGGDAPGCARPGNRALANTTRACRAVEWAPDTPRWRRGTHWIHRGHEMAALDHRARRGHRFHRATRGGNRSGAEYEFSRKSVIPERQGSEFTTSA